MFYISFQIITGNNLKKKRLAIASFFQYIYVASAKNKDVGRELSFKHLSKRNLHNE